MSNRINRMIISHWSFFDEQYVRLNRGSGSSLIRLSPIIGEGPRECIADSSLNFRQLFVENLVYGVSVSSSVPRDPKLGGFPVPENPGTREPEIYCGFRVLFLGIRNPDGFPVLRNARTRSDLF